MIKHFAHKGLRDFFLFGITKGIQAKHAPRIAGILDQLDAAVCPEDMNFPGAALHPLKGQLQEHWSVKVSANWRITFRFENGDAYVVNYQDYH